MTSMTTLNGNSHPAPVLAPFTAVREEGPASAWPQPPDTPRHAVAEPPADWLGRCCNVALLAIAALILAGAAASFAESYRGLWLWALRHSLSGFWADVFPVQIDIFIAVGELTLFVALVLKWRKRSRAGAWVVTLAGLAVSVAGNVGHVAGHDVASRVTAAVPPVAATVALAVGLGVLKRVVFGDAGSDTAAAATRRGWRFWQRHPAAAGRDSDTRDIAPEQPRHRDTATPPAAPKPRTRKPHPASDAAARKREADRKRIAAKRAGRDIKEAVSE